MSRFFATGSDSESESSLDEAPVVRQPTQAFYLSDSDDNKKRVIRTSYEKKKLELQTLIEKLKNLKKIKDCTNLVATFEDLTRVYQKAASVLVKSDSDQTPRFYIRCLVELDGFIQELWEDKDTRKNMSKNNSKSLATLRQKLRKYNKDYEQDIARYRENPELTDASEDDDDSDDDSDDKSDDEYDQDTAVLKSLAPALSSKDLKKSSDTVITATSALEIDSDQESNDSFWKQDSESESDSSDNAQYTTMRERFLKKTTDKDDDDAGTKKKDRKEKEKRRIVKETVEEDDDGGGEWETVRGGTAISTEKFKLFGKDEEITPAVVVKKLNEVTAFRGKKKSSRREILNMVNELQTVAEMGHMNAAILLKIKYSQIIAIYDYNYKVSDAMKPDNWGKLLVHMEELITILLKDPSLVKFSTTESDENLSEAPYSIRGSILIITEKLDEEFTKMLKEADPHSNEYVERLKDEPKVVNIITKLKTYLETIKAPTDELCLIYLRVVEHMYYKLDVKYIHQQSDDKSVRERTSLDEMNDLCKYIYANDNTDRLRTRAIMCHIYHHALHNNWYKARDLLLMSHLQETVTYSDPSTQILYNRTIANLGLCAFRHGNIRDAHNCLVDLMVSGKQKELLAQGLLPQKQVERSKEQEKIEKSRQIPFHMHINLELLECVYLISAMLIEIPYMAAHEFDARRKMISKTFYQLLRNSERQNLSGPPESMREHIVAATKAMRNGQWQQCVRYVISDKMNRKIWDLFYQSDEVKTMLTGLICKESLRTYLFTYSKVYDSISMDILGHMFELDRSVVHSIISKMIINEELMASLDEPSHTVVMHRTEPSRLQSLALQLTEKAAGFLDSNERILEAKQTTAMPSTRLQNVYRNDRPIYRNASGGDWGARQRKGQKV